MIEALARFVEALRAEELAVSPAEIVDAGRALDLVGLERRAEVRRALSATLAKDRQAALVFDRLFDRFFAPPIFRTQGTGEGRVATAGERPRPGEGDRPTRSHKKPKDKITAQGKASFEPKRPGPERKEHRGRHREAKIRRAGEETREPAHRDLARRMTTEEERELSREIPREVQALKLRVSRRLARARTGRPWMRQALRDNLKHGGVPFVIPYRAPKRRSTRVVLLVDVSFSVARASGLFLLMAAEFVELGRRARVLAFVDRPVDATAAVSRWARGSHREHWARDAAPIRRRRGARPGDGILSRDVSFADVLEGLKDLNLEAPSDYGTAFHALSVSRLRPRGRDTVLVVLGDGRTNRFDPLPFALEGLSRGCRAVLWLVPEPRSRWGTADSALPGYLPSVDLVVEATDLHGLSRGLGELLRRL
jgi:uncharacterized protein with von Willebrand factor type A (vWA) domain